MCERTFFLPAFATCQVTSSPNVFVCILVLASVANNLRKELIAANVRKCRIYSVLFAIYRGGEEGGGNPQRKCFLREEGGSLCATHTRTHT